MAPAARPPTTPAATPQPRQFACAEDGNAAANVAAAANAIIVCFMIFLAQVNAGDGVNPAPVTPYQGLDHFGLAVSGIDAIAADLRKKGVEFTKEPHSPRPGIKICFLRGPQGISIELLDRDPKYS